MIGLREQQEQIPTEEEKNREINLKSLKDWMEFFPVV